MVAQIVTAFQALHPSSLDRGILFLHRTSDKFIDRFVQTPLEAYLDFYNPSVQNLGESNLQHVGRTCIA